ncbi:Sperm-tail PG-rich repeat, putative [Angomonas deanei]|uniref:Sperm-tail PG-rich repeat, putative n=1 Tax=Angomonas deanei TaxID=59799 RepID=A0A7G2CRS2_9TRYP|nr:Sperm-tail PG-rich repeat, putative [Angomonas deanei]
MKKLPTPGPGQYNIANTINFMRGRSPQAIIPAGKERSNSASHLLKQKKLVVVRKPAPRSASEDKTQKREKIVYELVEEVSPTPGPGAYSPATRTVKEEIELQKEREKRIQSLLAHPEDNTDNRDDTSSKNKKKKKKKKAMLESAELQRRLQKECHNAAFRQTSKRTLPMENKKVEEPSPLDYHVVEHEQIRYPSAPKATFGTAPRRAPFGNEDTDEDDAAITIDMNSSAPDEKCSCGEKNDTNSKRKRKLQHKRSCKWHYKNRRRGAPGPGEYVITTGKEVGANAYQAPTMKLMAPYRDPKNNNNNKLPGPADYHVMDSYFNSIMPHTNAAVLTSSRQNMMKEIKKIHDNTKKEDEAESVNPYYYNIDQQVFDYYHRQYKQAPSFSFGTAPRHTMNIDSDDENGNYQDAAGPADYVPNFAAQWRRDPSAVFGTASRHSYKEEKEDAMVSPAYYDVERAYSYYNEKNNSNFAPHHLERRVLFMDALVREAESRPGPASYSPYTEDEKSQKGVSFPTAPREGFENHNGDNDVPGPGQYEVYHDNAKKKGVSFGNAPRENAEPSENNVNVGPGAYDPKREVEIRNNTHRGYSFPRSNENHNEEEEDAPPGPGQYETYYLEKMKYHRSPGAVLSMTGGTRQHHKEEEEEVIPGPGYYNVADEKQQRGVSFPTAPREGFENHNGDNDVPGPGQYEVYHDNSKKKGVSFGNAPREGFENENEQDVPGPGQYEVYHKKEGKGVRFPTAPREGFDNHHHHNDDEVPGPGQYEVYRDQQKKKGVSFGNAPRETLDEKEKDEVPGPGQYEVYHDPQHQHNKDKGGVVYFTTAQRFPPQLEDEKAALPGPGHYTLLDAYHASAAIFGTARKEGDNRHDNGGGDAPGPGYYHVEKKPEGPSHKFGTAPVEHYNDQKQGEEVPGPGYYNLERKSNKKEGVSFPTAPREGNEGDKENSAPGPGYYSVTVKPEGPSYKFGTAPVESKQEYSDAPGPGYYNIDGNKNKAGGVVFTTAPREREHHHKEDAPGPGYYSVTMKPEGPSHKFGTAPD